MMLTHGIRAYYRLSKPGIVYSNTFVALASFLFASHGIPSFTPLLTLCGGIALVIAGSAALNNVLDRDVDARMTRTNDRALVRGTISPVHAVVFGFAAILAGLVLLGLGNSVLTALLAAAAAVLYVGIYTPAKRWTSHSTIIGAVPGALPTVIGYAAATQQLDVTALLLFLALVTWQMAHFYAIGTYRAEEYAAAGLRIIPVRVGARASQHLIVLYTFAFALAIGAFGVRAHASIWYWLVSGSIALVWCTYGLLGYRLGTSTEAIRTWARRMFFISLAVIILFCISLVLA
jgi:protoheme IX farnesyltransferase